MLQVPTVTHVLTITTAIHARRMARVFHVCVTTTSTQTWAETATEARGNVYSVCLTRRASAARNVDPDSTETPPVRTANVGVPTQVLYLSLHNTLWDILMCLFYMWLQYTYLVYFVVEVKLGITSGTDLFVFRWYPLPVHCSRIQIFSAPAL